MKGHQPESLDWFNVLVAQTIAQLRADAQHEGAILKTLDTVLNGPQKPDFVGDIRITEISLGDEYPIFSNCRVIPVEEGKDAPSVAGDRLQARLDVDLADCITLGVETKLVLNYPKRLAAVLPVALAVSVVRFSGTLSLSFIPSADPPSNSSEGDKTAPGSPTTLAFSFLPDYRLDLSVRSLVGSRSRLQDVPKIAQLVEARIHQWFDERCVEPRVQQIVLPSLWPRKKNTRGGEEDASDEEQDDEGSTDTPSGDGSTEREAPSRSEAMQQDEGLAARMAAEGRKLRAAETRGERGHADRTQSNQPREGIRKRPAHKPMGSTDNLHIPGGFQ
jgi:maintenance of morphology protein 1